MIDRLGVGDSRDRSKYFSWQSNISTTFMTQRHSRSGILSAQTHTHTKIDSSEGSKPTQTGHDSASDTRGFELGVMATGVRGERSVLHGDDDESVYCSEK